MPHCDCPPYDCAGWRRKYLDGDREAGSELISKFGPLIRSIVEHALGPSLREDWLDARQVVSWHIIQKLAQWEARAPFCRWLSRVTLRKALDFRFSAMSNRATPTGDIHEKPDKETSIDVKECIKNKYDKMTKQMQEIFDLTIQGLQRDEVADAVGISIRTLQYRLEAIRELLKDCLEK